MKALQRQVDFGQGEARDRQVEVDIELFQLQKALAEQSLVPVGMLRQPVVRDPKGFQLRFRQMPDLDNRYARHPKLFSCQNSSMADNYLTLPVSHHGHHETKLPDKISELIDLTLGMLSRVARIQDEVCHRPIFNLDVDQAGVGCRVQLVGHHLVTLLSGLANPRRVVRAGKLKLGLGG